MFQARFVGVRAVRTPPASSGHSGGFGAFGRLSNAGMREREAPAAFSQRTLPGRRLTDYFAWFRQATSYCDTLAVLREFWRDEPA